MLDFEAFKDEYQKVPVEEYPNRVVEAVPDPVVSIHVSTYQHADFIKDCLDGVLMQETDFPFEVVIGEDESNDGTREICKEYADRHPEKIRLFLHRRENNISIHGQPTGRFQFTYSHFVTRGRYIAICEGDDYWTDCKKLQRQVGFLEKNERYVLSHHDAHIVDENGNIVEKSKLPEKHKREHSKEELMNSPMILTLSICFRNVIKNYPEGFFEVINADRFIISMLGEYGKGNYHEMISPSVYRIHEKGMWSNKTPENKRKEHIHTYEKIENYYKNKGKNKVREYFETRRVEAKFRMYLSEEEYIYAIRCQMIMLYKFIHNLELGNFASSFISSSRFILGSIYTNLKFKLTQS